MVADMERLENAARTAMGDYSHPMSQESASANVFRHLALVMAKLMTVMASIIGSAMARTVRMS